MKSYFVYILRCADGSYYTGVTNDIHRRVGEHVNGIDIDCYTFKRRPLVLSYVSEFSDVRDAIAWEKTLKRWSRKKKEAVIRGEFDRLPSLAARRTSFKKHCHPEEEREARRLEG